MLTDVLSVLHTEKRAMQKRLKLVNEAIAGFSFAQCDSQETDPGSMQNEVLAR
jgi:hypothetical protein